MARDATNLAKFFSRLQKETDAGANLILSRRVRSFGRRSKWRWVAFRLPLRPLPERLECDVKHRDQKDTHGARRQHAHKDRRADATAGNFRRTVCPYQGRQADDERDGGHHHGAEAQLRAELRRFP